jgi:hypothetical protein
MLARLLFVTAALAAIAVPCRAAELNEPGDPGARRSGAVVGAYFKLPLDGPVAARAPWAGLRLAMTHDYRTPAAPTARLIRVDGVDLRFAGRRAALYLGGRPAAAGEAKLGAGAGGGGRLDKVMLGAGVALAAVAGFVVVSSLD